MALTISLTRSQSFWRDMPFSSANAASISASDIRALGLSGLLTADLFLTLTGGSACETVFGAVSEDPTADSVDFGTRLPTTTPTPNAASDNSAARIKVVAFIS